jgi:hypothetical protein
MQPITREIIDRRQPAIRWSAVFAGTAVACGLWILLQIFGMGAGLVSLRRGAAIGSGAWSLIAPFLSMFIGGWVAGTLAGTRDEKLGALHGVIVWALTSVVGVLATVSLIKALAAGVAHTADVVVVTHNATEAAGKALLGAGVSLLVSLGTALLGGLLAVRGFHHDERRRKRRTTVQTPVVPPPSEIDTAAY